MLLDQRKTGCPIDEFSAYIDGELEPAREMELEEHLAKCPACVFELNQQKQFLCDLTSTLMGEGDLEVPADFAKHVVVNAESSVNGLRRRSERYNALLIGFGLLLFALIAMSLQAGDPGLPMGGAFDQVTAVIGFVGHLAYSFFFGLVVILRSIAIQVQVDASVNGPFLFFLLIALTAVSLRLLSTRRA